MRRGTDAGGRERRLERRPGLGIAGAGGLEDQPRTLDLVQDLGPERDHAAIDLRQVVERAEGDVAVALLGRRADLRGVARRGVGEKAARQADQVSQ
jgi:hypothetical protein